MGKLYGIDLGTTFSSIATLNELGKPEIIPNVDGERIMASAVYFKGDSVFTGREAVQGGFENAANCIKFIKRKMEEEDYRVNIEGKEYSPAEISSFILKKLANDASRATGEEVKDVVITIPANFADHARTATINAGKMAGLNVVGLINEPSAAACYYALEHNIAGRVLIFDLGGGTFDVTVAEVNGSKVQIKASSGDRNLGGVDFDEALLKHFEELYQSEINEDLYKSAEERNEILDYCEDVKKSLSKREEISFTLKGTAGRHKGTIKRDTFEQLIASYIARIEMLVETVLDESDDTVNSINHILLVGGSSRIPAVQEMLKKMFGKEPTHLGHLDETVCFGGAIYTGLRMLEDNPDEVHEGIAAGLRDVKLSEVCSHFFGTVILARDEILEKDTLQNSIILEKNTPVPCSQTKTYYTTTGEQRTINARITQSSEPTTDMQMVAVVAEGTFSLPANLPESAPIEITFSYDKDLVMTAVFEHKESGETFQFAGNPKTGFASESIVNSSASLDDFTIE